MYQGDIKGYGDSVVIRMAPMLTITDHEIGADISDAYEIPESTSSLLEINKAKKFAFQLDSIDELQSDIPLMDEFVSNAGEGMAVAIDTTILVDIQDDAAAENKGLTAGIKSGNLNMGTTATPRQADSTDILDFILDGALVLDEQNVPRTGNSRALTMPPALIRLLKGSDQLVPLAA